MSLPSERAAVFAAVQCELLKAARTSPPASAVDIRPHLKIPSGVHPSIIGAAIRELKRAGLIVEVGYVSTTHKAGHGHLMRTWRLADPPAGQSASSTGGEVTQ